MGEVRDDEALGLGEEHRALEPDLAQLVRDGAEHVAEHDLAAQAGACGGEQGVVLARALEILREPRPGPLLAYLKRRVVRAAPRRSQDGAERAAVEAELEGPGAHVV